MKCRTIQSSHGVKVFALFLIIWALTAVCHTLSYAYSESADPYGYAKITNIKVIDRPSGISVVILGDRILTYTSVKQTSPLALILFFSKTKLDTSETAFTPPNGIIHSTVASEILRKDPIVKVKILLKKDAFQTIARDGTKLKITFQKRTRTAKPQAGPEKYQSLPSDSPARPATSFVSLKEKNLPTATRLQSVYAARFGDSLKVFVGADGMIKNYRSFTIESPPRIVFDIFNIKSPYEKEKIIPVNTKWVKDIRYFSYPDRVRVILDTEKRYLSSFNDYPIENGLLIHMGRQMTKSHVPQKKYAASKGSRGMTKGANLVKSVYASQLGDSMLVTVRGDGSMTKYKSYTSQNPPRIMVDIFDVTSPYRGEQFFPVDTKWVKSVRHEGYGNKVQLIIDTRLPYLNNFSVHPDENGLVVQIGPAPVATRFAQAPSKAPASRQAPVNSSKNYTKPALVNEIEFLSEDAGKSNLVIITTRPVEYDIKETGDKILEVKLYNTILPKRQERPLITDRFESAVDEIVPKRKPSMKNTALFNIRLREAVPYFVEQNNEILKIHFEASSISPKPLVGIKTAQTGPSPKTALPTPIGSNAPKISQGTPLPGPSPEKGVASAKQGDLTLNMDDDLELEEKGPKYTGEKIALDFYETDIKNVFRILRDVSGKNFAIDKDVTGKVTLTLGEPVPWDQILDLILKMNKLGKTVEGNIIRIATRETLAEEERLKQEKKTAELTLKDQQKQLEPLVTEYIAVNYSNAKSEIMPHIQKILTKDRGSVSVDERTNVVILTDTADVIKKAKELISKLDRVTPQVIIEARVVEASTRFKRSIGTQWQVAIGVQEVGNDGVIDVGGTTDEVSKNVNERVGKGPQRGYNELGGTYGYNMAMDFPLAADAFGSIGFNFVRIAGTPLLLNAKLSAMESQGEGKIISAPKIVTLDNKKAVIKQGISYPYQTVEDGETNTEFKEVDLLLEVTPHVTPDNRISLNIVITKNDLGDVINFQQSFTTKEARTELLVNDGDTVVIGGIIKTTERDNNTGIPGLSKIPILGWLFKAQEKVRDKEELLIFITPMILKLEQRTVQY